jgi:sulfoxide reductase catalytic subunit YedY
MNTRRRFLRLTLGSAVGAGLVGAFDSAAQRAWAASKRVLAEGTMRDSLIHEDPAALDTTHLDITPLEDFGTMGPTDEIVPLDTWHLEISGQVKAPVRLRYPELTALPPVERNVLLICPGVFVNHGRWKGVSMRALLRQVEPDRAAGHLLVEGRGGKSARFPLADVLSDKVFLAYQVNGKALPRKHGFPLRVVAEGYYGYDWVKYVAKIMVGRA